MSTISIKEVQENTTTVFHRVQAGEHFVITRDGQPVAELHPIAPSPPIKKRPYGLAAGQFTVPDDFDAPLPNNILDEFEGK
jgi:antitoxin (DNA-binding transcriptional repressor) of toxin-antitoxin stability system